MLLMEKQSNSLERRAAGYNLIKC